MGFSGPTILLLSLISCELPMCFCNLWCFQLDGAVFGNSTSYRFLLKLTALFLCQVFEQHIMLLCASSLFIFTCIQDIDLLQISPYLFLILRHLLLCISGFCFSYWLCHVAAISIYWILRWLFVWRLLFVLSVHCRCLCTCSLCHAGLGLRQAVRTSTVSFRMWFLLPFLLTWYLLFSFASLWMIKFWLGSSLKSFVFSHSLCL